MQCIYRFSDVMHNLGKLIFTMTRIKYTFIKKDMYISLGILTVLYLWVFYEFKKSPIVD